MLVAHFSVSPFYRVQSCSFCAAPAVALCGWRVLGFEVVGLFEVAVGDRITRRSGFRGRAPAKVEAVRDWTRDGKQFRAVDLRLKTGRLKVICGPAGSVVRREALVPCGSLCCEAHLREVDDQVHYCQMHWRSWEAA